MAPFHAVRTRDPEGIDPRRAIGEATARGAHRASPALSNVHPSRFRARTKSSS